MITNNSCDTIPTGIYQVGNQYFDSKVTALQAGDSSGIHPTWNFFDEEFSKFAWKNEPAESVEYYYGQRCQQIRDKYSYIVLHYSGGADSHNILVHFWKNKIHIDEIIVSLPVSYFEKFTKPTASTDSGDQQNEWFHTIKPDLEWIAKNLPNTKVTIYDYTEDMINFKVDQDWVIHSGEHINPNVTNRINRYDKISTSDIYNKHLVGHIYGIDKPLVFKDGDRWAISFLDSMISIQASLKPIFDRYTHIRVEHFYWSPDLPAMAIKQAHLVKQQYEKNPHLLHLATRTRKTLVDKEIERNLTREAVYPYWRQDIFQNAKSSNVFFKEFDQWFFKYGTESAKGAWWEGYNYLINSVSSRWIDCDVNGKPSGLKGFWSKIHYIE